MTAYGIDIFDVSNLTWRTGRKTKGLRAKPMSALLVDKSVVAKFLVDTLEGVEPIHAGTIFCIGEGNDAWPQTAKKLIAKYNLVDIDDDGWMHWTPKPENSVDFYEVKPTDYEQVGYIRGLWGATVNGVKNLQQFGEGDRICRNQTDHSDVWIVKKRIWETTYEEIA